MGLVVRFPVGGMAWHYLQYVLGIHALGHDVLYVEDSDDHPSCYDPSRFVTDDDPAFGLRFATTAFAHLDLADRWAYFDAHRGSWHGPLGAAAEARIRDADLLINVSNANPVRDWAAAIPLRVSIDTDPGFTQARLGTDLAWRDRVRSHSHFYTFGEAIGGGPAVSRDDEFGWRPTRQPVVLEAWPVRPVPPGAGLTTVMQWNAYRERRYNGVRLGMKSESMEGYLDLPDRVEAELELAVGGSEAPRRRLIDAGWRIRDALDVTRDLRVYQDYVQSSAGEFSVAKHGYVALRTGWFSERSANYLASGRPVVTQDTGFSELLPVGEGLLAFDDPDSAADAVERVRLDPALHRRRARELAEAFFDSRVVLSRMIESVASDR